MLSVAMLFPFFLVLIANKNPLSERFKQGIVYPLRVKDNTNSIISSSLSLEVLALGLIRTASPTQPEGEHKWFHHLFRNQNP